MVCVGIENLTDSSITGILAFPTSCDYFFYAKIMAGIFIILSFTLFQIDRRRRINADMLSSMGVSALAVIVISLAGTLLTIIKPDVFIQIFVVGIIFIALWLIRR